MEPLEARSLLQFTSSPANKMTDKRTPERGTIIGINLNYVMLSGTSAVELTATAPIERVKLLVQCQGEMLRQGVLDKPYNGVLDCTRRTMAREGLFSFWRGNLPSVLKLFPKMAFDFALQNTIKAMFNTPKNARWSEKVAKNVLSGGCAGSISLALLHPLDFAHTRMANDVKYGKYGRRLQDVYRMTLKSDGIRGVYRGFVISCGGIFIQRGIFYGLYDSLKPTLKGENTYLFYPFILTYAYGVMLTASLICYPMDTIKRRMMMTSGEAMKYKNSMDCCAQILKIEGFMAMMKGASMHIIRSVTSAGVLVGLDILKNIYIRRAGS